VFIRKVIPAGVDWESAGGGGGAKVKKPLHRCS